MIKVQISSDKELKIKNLVLDFNGTIALDGKIKESIKPRIIELARQGLDIYIITADTYKTAYEECKDLPVKVRIYNNCNESKAKGDFVKYLGSENTISFGNGNNDALMFDNSLLSVAIISEEGCFTKSALKSDILMSNILDAFDLLLNQNRLRATLRY